MGGGSLRRQRLSAGGACAGPPLSQGDLLNVGDYIQSVNGIHLTRLIHDEIITLLKNVAAAWCWRVEFEAAPARWVPPRPEPPLPWLRGTRLPVANTWVGRTRRTAWAPGRTRGLCCKCSALSPGGGGPVCNTLTIMRTWFPDASPVVGGGLGMSLSTSVPALPVRHRNCSGLGVFSSALNFPSWSES